MVIFRIFSIALCSSALVLSACTNSGPAPDESKRAVTAEAVAPTTATAQAEESPAAGIADADREAAAQIVSQMSDEQLAGSVIMATFSSTDPAQAAALVNDNHLAGAIVMNFNLPDGAGAAEVQGITSALRSAAGERGWPAVIGVDQEGGIVARVREATLPFPSLMAGGAATDKAVVTEAAKLQGTELRELGFTVDFAPVADVTIGSADKAIKVRSAGSEQKNAAATVNAAVQGYQQAGILSSAKHFPGHGALTADSHEELPVSEDGLAELEDKGWAPFESAVEAHVPMVMVGHIALPDAEKLPASLNPKVYKSLRNDLNFEDVAVTDALNMGAVVGQPGDPAVNAIKAGADLALMPPDAGASAKAILGALESGELDRERLVEAATRVVSMSLAQDRVAGSGTVPSMDSLDAEQILSDYADAALTVIKGKCSYQPEDTFQVVAGDAEVRATLARELEAAGLREGAGGVRIAVGARAQADIAVGTGAPWEVDRANAKTIINVYSGNEYVLKSAASYIAGRLEASAKAPVKVRTKAPNCSG